MDRGLLVGLLALQNQFILPAQFLVGFQTWLATRTHPLDELLVQHAYLTKSQRESLALTLIGTLEKSHNHWETAVAENNAIDMVYHDMLAFAEKDASVLEWVKQIGACRPIVSLPVDASRPMSADKDPYGTIDFDNEFGPFATLSEEENQTEQ